MKDDKDSSPYRLQKLSSSTLNTNSYFTETDVQKVVSTLSTIAEQQEILRKEEAQKLVAYQEAAWQAATQKAEAERIGLEQKRERERKAEAERRALEQRKREQERKAKSAEEARKKLQGERRRAHAFSQADRVSRKFRDDLLFCLLP
jgi:hypothetical protein